MLKRPNICYVFERQGVTGLKIWHSEKSIGQLFIGQPVQTKTFCLWHCLSKFLMFGVANLLCPSLLAPAAAVRKDLTRSYLCKRPSKNHKCNQYEVDHHDHHPNFPHVLLPHSLNIILTIKQQCRISMIDLLICNSWEIWRKIWLFDFYWFSCYSAWHLSTQPGYRSESIWHPDTLR